MRLPYISIIVGMFAISTSAAAQTPPPERDRNWGVVSTVSLLTGAGTQLLMPRIFYSDPEVTVGWKARWHVSALAPVMTLAGIAILNEYALKDAFDGYRPGCDASNQGGPGCRSFGMMSTHALGGFGALGHGAAVFIFDTTKWSGGRFNGAGFVGNLAIPLVTATLTDVARGQGHYESTGKILVGTGVGLASGFLMGTLYSLMQRPECGYSGSMICW